MNLLNDIVKEDNKDWIEGFVFTGVNHSGKSYYIENLFHTILDKDEDEDVSIEYQIKNCIYLSKNMNKQGLRNTSYTRGLLGTVENSEIGYSILDLIGESKELEIKSVIDYKNDTLDATPFSEAIFNSIVHRLDHYQELLYDLIGLNISYNESNKKLEIKLKQDEPFRPLDSSGYQFIIRLIVILEELLTEDIQWIMIDEPDAELDTKNENIFSNVVKAIKDRKGCSAKLVFSTHRAGSIYALPENYMIYKFYTNGEIHRFYSQDFFNKAQVEQQLFNLEDSQVYKSAIMIDLIEKYKKVISGSDMEINLEGYKYETLSLKEKVVYNSIRKLIE